MLMSFNSLSKTAILNRMVDIGCVVDIDYRFTGKNGEIEFFDICDECDCSDYDPINGDIMW